MTETDGHKEHRIGMKEETQVFRDNQAGKDRMTMEKKE